MRMAKNGEAFTLKRVMLAGNRYLCRKVMRMGSVWWFPLTRWTTRYSGGFWTKGCETGWYEG